MYNRILNYAIDLAVILSMQMIVVHKGNGDWSSKLSTESNGMLSMNMVSMVTLRLENNRLLLHPHSN